LGQMNIFKISIIVIVSLILPCGCATPAKPSYVADIAAAYGVSSTESLDSIASQLRAYFISDTNYSDVISFLAEVKSRSAIRTRLSIVDNGKLVGFFFAEDGRGPEVGFLFKFSNSKLVYISYFRTVSDP
jgi:hypothetical protein